MCVHVGESVRACVCEGGRQEMIVGVGESVWVKKVCNNYSQSANRHIWSKTISVASSQLADS